MLKTMVQPEQWGETVLGKNLNSFQSSVQELDSRAQFLGQHFHSTLQKLLVGINARNFHGGKCLENTLGEPSRAATNLKEKRKDMNNHQSIATLAAPGNYSSTNLEDFVSVLHARLFEHSQFLAPGKGSLFLKALHFIFKIQRTG
jgi:hypothetical protein